MAVAAGLPGGRHQARWRRIQALREHDQAAGGPGRLDDPLTRTVGASTDREPVRDASRMRRGSLQAHGAVTSTTLRTVKREEEEDWGKCPALIPSCVMLGRKIGRQRSRAAGASRARVQPLGSERRARTIGLAAAQRSAGAAGAVMQPR